MLPHAHDHGVADALSLYGLNKTAVALPTALALGHAARAASGAVNWVKARPGAMANAVTSPEWWKGVGQSVKRTAVGEPTKFYHQLRNGTLLNKEDGLVRQALRPEGFLSGAVMYGMPAYQAYQLNNQTSAENRGSALGEFAGSTLGGLAGNSLGLVGSIGGSMLMGNAGRTLGSVFDSSPPPAVRNVRSY